MNLVGLYRRGVASVVVLLLAGVAAASAQTCNNTPGTSPDDVIAACTRLISAGRVEANTLAHYYNNRAVALSNKHDNDHAIDDYSRAIKINSRDAVTYANRGISYHQKGDEKQAIDDFSRSLELDPKSANTYLNRARAYRALRDYDKAIQDTDKAVQLDPKLAAGYFLRALIYSDKSDYDRTFTDLNQAISLNQNISVYYRERAKALERKGSFEQALLDYGEAVRLDPTDFFSFKFRGLVRRRKGDFPGAMADYDQAIKLDPQYSAAYVERGRLYEVLNNPAAARASYEIAASLPPKYDTGKSAVDTARARLVALSNTANVTPAPAPSIIPPPPTPAPTPPVKPPSQAVVPPAPIPGPPANAPRKLALVLGNSAYQRQPLRNPDNDARAMAKVFRQIGFQVIDGYNLDYAGMRRIISDFAVKATNAQLAVVYYAGHGIGIAGHNYLVPIDAKMESTVTASFELFDLDQIIASVDDPARTTVVILDACRNNPFATQATSRAMNRGAGLVGYDSVSAGMLIAFATRPGQVAKDGSGDHSPFTGALLKYIATPNLEILDMLRRVRRDVLQETNGEQITWDNESLFGNVFLADVGPREVAK